MKRIKSEKIDSLLELFCQLFEKKLLKKAVFSKPDSTDEIKIVITPKEIGAKPALQVETFSKDNKAYHLNIRDSFFEQCEPIFYSHSQINIISTIGDCQYMSSKSGKESLVGFDKLKKKISIENVEKAKYEKNNKSKKYILSGKEEFLKKLGISDENGRIRDKMQAKYRQINKFLEHIKSIEAYLPSDFVNVYDLCCGKSYLSFAVYYYFKFIKNIGISMKCVDLKEDVIEYCSNVARRIGFDNMEFVCANINDYTMNDEPHLVISLHACDIATDIVLNKASENGARVILSTPCCHHMLNHEISCEGLEFITKHSMLRQKLCDAATDAVRLLRLVIMGYDVSALELIDPEDTPKNIILRAIKKKNINNKSLESLKAEYKRICQFLVGDKETIWDLK
ncbi:MAG: SAM-dependent methyltransferase [Clostridia bacterium]|nr:SAM-dependent methyltransferase [Clostridia bacterium]